MMEKEYFRICKHRPKHDCTHYQKEDNGKVVYLKFDSGNWYLLNSNSVWERLEDWYVEFFIANPNVINKSIDMVSKYDWSKVPEDINYIASCEGGFAFGYKSKPMSGHLHRGFWYGAGDGVFLFWPDEHEFNNTNWRNSLEKRKLNEH